MVKRNPNVIGIAIVAALYWGALFYWIRDDLTGDIAEDQTRALLMFATSIPYVAFVMWGTMRDIPNSISEIPVLGKYFKAYVWLLIMAGLIFWGI